MPTQFYHLGETIIRIRTKHFTKFVVLSNESAIEITDALLTVAAHYYKSHKAFVNLRLMLHSHCAGLEDFAAARMQV